MQSIVTYFFSDLMTPSQTVRLTRQEYRSSHHSDSHCDSETGIPSASAFIKNHFDYFQETSFRFIAPINTLKLTSLARGWKSGLWIIKSNQRYTDTVSQEYFKIQYMFYVVYWNVFNILKIFKEMVKIHFVFVILSNLFALKYPVQIPKGRKTNAKTAF